MQFYINQTSYVCRILRLCFGGLDFSHSKEIWVQLLWIAKETGISKAKGVTINVNRQKCTICPHKSPSNRERLLFFFCFAFSSQIFQSKIKLKLATILYNGLNIRACLFLLTELKFDNSVILAIQTFFSM